MNAIVDGPWLPQQIDHLEFHKMLISLQRIKISAPNLVGRCITTIRRGADDQKSKPEVNSGDVIKRTAGTTERRSRGLQQMFEPALVQSSSTSLPLCRNVPNSLIMKIQDGGGRHIEFRKIFPDRMDMFALNYFGAMMHHCHSEMIT